MANTPPQTTEMQLLVERMRKGDAAASDELCRRVCNRMERLARKMLKGFPNVQRWTDTDDVLQNGLMRLLRSLQKLKPNNMRAFYGLAATELRRELIDLARHFYGPEGCGANHQSVGSEKNEFAPELDPEDRHTDTSESDKWCRFHTSVENLPTELREIVSLIYYHGWTQSAVAELFQVTERTIRRKWQEALFQLRDELQGELPTA